MPKILKQALLPIEVGEYLLEVEIFFLSSDDIRKEYTMCVLRCISPLFKPALFVEWGCSPEGKSSSEFYVIGKIGVNIVLAPSKPIPRFPLTTPRV